MEVKSSNKKILIVGAGPCGISQLIAFEMEKMNLNNKENFPELICIEKQSKPCGLWNYTNFVEKTIMEK